MKAVHSSATEARDDGEDAVDRPRLSSADHCSSGIGALRPGGAV